MHTNKKAKYMIIDIHWMRLVPEKELKRFPSKVVYGPVVSKRSFYSLGINFWPDRKVCTFDCRYCHCGKSSTKTEDAISFEAMMDEIERAFQFHAKNNSFVQDIVVEGNGEPTIYPRFYEATLRLMELRDRYFPNISLVLYTNSTNLENGKVIEAILNYDQAFFKLDSADDGVVKRLDGAKKPVGKIIEGIALVGALIRTNRYRLKNFDISTAVVGSPIGNYDSLLEERFIYAMRMIRPDRIYLYDIDRFSPGEKYDFRIGQGQLESLAKHIFEKAGVEIIALFSRKGRGVHELSEINALKAVVAV